MIPGIGYSQRSIHMHPPLTNATKQRSQTPDMLVVLEVHD